MCLLGEFSQREHHNVRRTEHRHGTYRAGEHRDLKPEIERDPRGNCVEHRGGIDTFIRCKDCAIALAPFGEVHFSALSGQEWYAALSSSLDRSYRKPLSP